MAKVVVFNRLFSLAILISVTVYFFQITSNTSIITFALIAFALIVVLFNILLIEVIGQIIRKKTILTHEICVWLGKVISISMMVVVTVACVTTGNLYIASFFCIPIIIATFLGESGVKRIGVFAVLFVLIFQHTGLAFSNLLINNTVSYEPSSIIQAVSIACIIIITGIIVNKSKKTDQKANILQSMAMTDGLTGLINRRYFDRRIAEEIARAKRHNSNLSLAMFDIDHFKRVNDTYGHTVGDKILNELGDLILENIRESDVSARYGGEEFVLILPETTQIEAYELLERLRQLIECNTFVKDESTVLITVSVGIAQYHPEYNSEDFIEQADASLYQAKRTGRNRVVYGTFTTPRLNLQKITNYAETIK